MRRDIFRCSCLIFTLLAVGCSSPTPRAAGVVQDDIADVADADATAADVPASEDVTATVDTAAAPDVADAADTAGADAAPPDAQADASQPDGGLLPGQCPIPGLVVQEGGEVVPQTMLHLHSDGSQAASDTAIAKYLWTVTQPDGSLQPLLPNATFPNPTLQANVAGKYEFCLDVWDGKGKEACNKGCIDVNVVPSNALHIELLWDTPLDPDQTNSGPAAGADFDLHLAHPMAAGPDLDCDGTPDPWFSNPWDCFWFNPNPNWGSANPAAQDDPSLDLDDTDGMGPENMNLPVLEGTKDSPMAYSIGAHYWNDHGYGQSFATVRIYVLGNKIVDLGKVAMDALDMWYVGKINWPNTMSGGTLPVFSPCYQSGDACGAGKMWQPSGDWCITKCYDNKSFTASAGGAKPATCAKP